MCISVCTHCDNSIKIIGLYKQLEYCPYHDRRIRIPSKSKKPESAQTERLKQVLRDNYDRIIYIIENSTGLKISDKLAETFIKTYGVGRSWQYEWTTLNNLPWTFAYRTNGQTLYGRKVRVGSDLHKALIKNAKDIVFVEDVYGNAQIVAEAGK
jgi:hypothetical protein